MDNTEKIVVSMFPDGSSAGLLKNLEVPECNKHIKFNTLFSPINDMHMDYCDCANEIYNRFLPEQYEIARKELAEKKLTENIFVQGHMDNARRVARQLTIDYCQKHDIRCKHEEKHLQNLITLFLTKKDLSKPESVIIVESVLSAKLSAYRLARLGTEMGPLLTYVDKHGNTRHSLNPIEQLKLQYDTGIIDAMTKLSNITDGQLIQHRGQLTVAQLIDNIIDIEARASTNTPGVKPVTPGTPK